MKYVVLINNDERLENGEEDTDAIVKEEVTELLGSGYFETVSVVRYE